MRLTIPIGLRSMMPLAIRGEKQPMMDLITTMPVIACNTEAQVVQVMQRVPEMTVRFAKQEPSAGTVPAVAILAQAYMATDFVGSCALILAGRHGEVVGFRDAYVYAHWPELGEDLWVPLKGVSCTESMKGSPFRFECGGAERR